MEFPKFLKPKFSYPYGFEFLFFTDYDKYIKSAAEFMVNKIERVFLFLQILEESLGQEVIRCPRIFSQLQHHGVNLPNFPEIRRNVTGEILELADDFPEGDREKILEAVRRACSGNEGVRVASQLKSHFIKTYYTGRFSRFRLAAMGRLG